MTFATNESIRVETPDHYTDKPVGELETEQLEPTLRLHLWLETDEGVFFGTGRALLLVKIEEYGSLKRAAEDLGMSYRAAWGKIRATEEVLGVKLIAQNGCKKGGQHLTKHGLLLKEKYLLWFEEVERWALRKAKDLFPWRVKGFKEKASNKIMQCLVAFSMSLCQLEPLIECTV